MIQIKISELKKLAQNKFGDISTESQNKILVMISTGMCARTSYTVVGEEKEFGYEKQIQLHDRMANQVPFHASPFEHNARVMTQEEYDANPRCRNFSGFIQYRHLLENKNA